MTTPDGDQPGTDVEWHITVVNITSGEDEHFILDAFDDPTAEDYFVVHEPLLTEDHCPPHIPCPLIHKIEIGPGH